MGAAEHWGIRTSCLLHSQHFPAGMFLITTLGMGSCASLTLPQHTVPSASLLPSSPTSLQTLLDFSSRNYISAKQGSEASGASAPAPVSAKLNQCSQKTQQALHTSTSATTTHFPANRWGAANQEKVKSIFFPLFKSWLGWRSLQTPQTLRKPQCPHLPWILKSQLLGTGILIVLQGEPSICRN